jgi:hypothetical protein
LDYYLHAKDKSHLVGQVPYLAIDFENESHVGGAKSFKCAHVFGYYKKRRGVRYTDINGKSKTKSEYDLVHVDLPFNNREKLCDFLMQVRPDKKTKAPCILVFFNAKYDYTFLQDISNDSKRLTNGSAFIIGRLNNGIKMLDIHNHFKASLSKAIDVFGMNDAKKNLCGEAIFKTEIEVANESPELLAQHNRWDTMATWELAEQFRQIYNQVGVDLKATAPSNALEIFRTSFFPKDFSIHRIGDDLNILERKAYFGGRCEMFRRGKQGILSYDVHSMYPSVMVEHVYPDPGNSERRGDRVINSSVRHYKEGADTHWRKWYDKGYLGVFTCKVSVPDMHIPILPIKHIVDNAEKLIFPVGEFEGTWTSVELRAAEAEGVKILSCSEFVIYRKAIPLFKPYIEYCWEARAKAKAENNLPMSEFWKLMMNSLYGKFAEYHRDGGYYGKVEDADWDKINLEGKRPAYATIDGVQYISIPDDKRTEDSEHTIPCLAAFVTAYARLKLISGAKRLEKAGYKFVYCDTDSIKVTMPSGKTPSDAHRRRIDHLLGVGDMLGQFGYEHESSGRYYFQGQKSYAKLKTENGVDTIDFGCATFKGMNANFEKTYTGDLNNPDTVIVSGEGEQPMSEKMGIRREIPFQKWDKMRKNLSGHGNKRLWTGLTSTPITL